MSVSARPHTKFAAALVAAGVVSAATVVRIPEPPAISADVANASVITDALYGLGLGVGVLSSTVGIHVDATISLPFEATLAVLAAAEHPELGPNVLSYLVQRFVNPAVGGPIDAYPWEFRQTIAVLAGLLPYPLGPSASQQGFILAASQAVADAFNGVLGQLADPLPGLAAVNDVKHNTVLGRTVVAGQLAARAPLYAVWNTVNYLGMLPANLAAAFESALQTPNQIPGLISYLVHGLLSPDPEVGLLGKLLNNVVDPFTWLPGPVGRTSATAGGWANQLRNVIVGVINGLLSFLPAPVRPSALPPSDDAQTVLNGPPAAQNSFPPDSPLPSASLAVADAVTLTPATPDEKRADTGSTTQAPQAAEQSQAAQVDEVVAGPGVVATAADDAVESVKSDADDTDADDTDADDTEADDTDADDTAAKAKRGEVRRGNGEPVKDAVTRPRPRHDHTTPGTAEPRETEKVTAGQGSAPGGSTGTDSGDSGAAGSNASPGDAA
jgi:hypothetical protein